MMSGWKKKRFDKIGKCIRGVSYRPDDLREAPGPTAVTLLRSNNIRDGRLNFQNLQFVDINAVRSDQQLQSGDVAICMSNGNRALVGKAGQFTNTNDGLQYTVGAFCSIFRPSDEYDTDFVRHQFGSPFYQKQLDVILAGSAINNLKGSDVGALVAECPESPHEQSKIAEVLSKVDQAIEQTESLIAKQQRIKTGLMQDLLSRGIDEHGSLRSEETHEFKDSPLGRIPVEWKVDKLENISDFITSGSRGWARYYSEEGDIFIRIGNLTREHIHMRFDDVVYVNPPLTSEGKRTAISAGDLLISITADLGIIAVIPDYFPEAYVNQHIALVRLNKSQIVPFFAGLFLAGYRGQSQFDKLNESGAKAGLNLPTVKKLLVPRLDISEQEQIVKTLEANFHALKGHQSQLSKLRSLKTALMQDLLTGKVRVTPLIENMGVSS
jgi:type I restriction enzyme S subunit